MRAYVHKNGLVRFAGTSYSSSTDNNVSVEHCSSHSERLKSVARIAHFVPDEPISEQQREEP